MASIIPQLLVNGVYAGSLYGLVGLGFVLEYRVSRAFNLAYPAFVALGAYGCWGIYQILGDRWLRQPVASVIAAAAGGLLLAAATSWLLDWSVFGQLRKRQASPLVVLLASLGIFSIIHNVISIVAGDDTKVIRSVVVERSLALRVPALGVVHLTLIQAGVATTCLAVGLIMAAAARFSPWGQQMRAVANDPELGLVVGLPLEQIHTGVRVLSGALAGLAGIWLALDTDLTPLMGYRFLLVVAAAMVIGGIGSLPGVLLGSLVLGLIQNLGVLVFATQWQDFVAFALLILFLVFRPHGLLGRFA